jgi:hypothetical protein
MTRTISILSNGFFSIYTIAIFGIVGFIAGFVIRLAVNAKQKKNILKLEDEMLNNHSRILTLEKKISRLEVENAELSKFNSRKADLKVS